MGLRDRRQERRDERRGVTTYRMREKLFAIGDDYWIEDNQGQRVLKVNGKALRIRDTLVLEDPSGRELLKIQERKLRIRDTMEIEDASGHTVATVKKAMITPLRERFKIELAAGGELEAHGNIVDHEYEIERGGTKVAEVSKRWFRVADTYGVEVEDGQDPVLALAITVVVDQMTHDVG
ncbi:MAG: LURP-one-related family protein [Nocardioides sp.]|nr:LURP-one-related family protein [Nocardioides sp.]